MSRSVMSDSEDGSISKTVLISSKPKFRTPLMKKISQFESESKVKEEMQKPMESKKKKEVFVIDLSEDSDIEGDSCSMETLSSSSSSESEYAFDLRKMRKIKIKNHSGCRKIVKKDDTTDFTESSSSGSMEKCRQIGKKKQKKSSSIKTAKLKGKTEQIKVSSEGSLISALLKQNVENKQFDLNEGKERSSMHEVITESIRIDDKLEVKGKDQEKPSSSQKDSWEEQHQEGCNSKENESVSKTNELSEQAISEGYEKCICPVSTPISNRSVNEFDTIKKIRSMSEDELNSFEEPGAVYSESTLKKHAWVQKVYDAFCEMKDMNGFPLDEKNITSFLRFCYRSRIYTRDTVENVFACSLKRINTEITGQRLTEEVRDAISLVIKEGRVDKGVKPNGCGKEPCLLKDVERIVENTSDLHPDKAMEASLWLTAVSTGARAVTMCNVLLSDIGVILDAVGKDTKVLKMKFRVTKGNIRWNHDVTLEGNLEERTNTNVLYWLNEHLKKSFKLDLHNRDCWVLTETQKEQKIWNWRRDSMSMRLRLRARAAGYPINLFSFHSFRSGFMCSALLATGLDAHSRDSTFTFTAAIAGWVPNSAVQQRYAKNAISATIVSSRIGNPDVDGKEVIEKALLDIEVFHNIKLDKNCNHNVSDRFAVRKVRIYFKSRIAVNGITGSNEKTTKKKRYYYKQRAWRSAICSYVKNDAMMERNAYEIYSKHKNFKKSRCRHSTILNGRMEVGLRKIAQRIEEGEDENKIAEELIELVDKEEMEGKKEMKQIKRKKVYNYDAALQRERDENGRRKRLRWSEEEDETLKRMRKEGKSYSEMAEELRIRLPTDCRDRLINLGLVEGWTTMAGLKMRTRKTLIEHVKEEVLKDEKQTESEDKEKDEK
ncbi:uncharacterized protein MONOS_3458 [Monocercomonoides exilis]|uniref:uncharacterized protein n=1 Tax=Monocercomonoides exilis TaxID=2049356 RepID=UPI0035594EC4|nr:hypothetical protein MONOS_3458 [Monocercomonoides exilis]|eukprot:MONOS_3458.1-p1 / transcript=MONOS_3458.1 / gene=MONOS_3458 / organism=Monocercomonoides_exilis_PA203 / gene_product=unspecified product / transcript_product=unspecified product / location=Mono_scaffold00081:138198-140855(-) / protein_length=885 / sequence_SO=supercontig / SO=protein_coding / is_pseudo=false